jgi:hypothetical protein
MARPYLISQYVRCAVWRKIGDKSDVCSIRLCYQCHIYRMPGLYPFLAGDVMSLGKLPTT